MEVLHFLTDVRVFRVTNYNASINYIFVAFQDHTNSEIIKPFTETFKRIHSELALYRCLGPQNKDMAARLQRNLKHLHRINQTEMLSYSNILLVKCYKIAGMSLTGCVLDVQFYLQS